MTTTAVRTSALRAQARFRALLLALASPGVPTPLGQPSAFSVREAAAAFTVAETLLDHEVTFAVLGDGLDPHGRARLVEELRLRTGARPASQRAAEFVFVFSKPGPALANVCTGDLQDPERGCTLIWAVDGFAEGTAARLSGPGIESAVDLRLAGVAASDLQTVAALNGGYPCGVDVFFVDCVGLVVGLPRAVRIQLLT